ncbi:hypothetical protein BOX15_Mlig019071g1 [Macrostomum lignano]|uniref:F-box domain-containing protein n=1 Tax=Macrostomum lignano TaxID=282301 RepID=A0A267GN43_9PLAT|nr:hypothetical protein BOX15_Mlig019071g1 [Macrostomum lignano]
MTSRAKGRGRNSIAAVSDNPSSLTFADLPAKLMIKVFSYLSHSELCRICLVSKRWRELAYDSRLWTNLRLRPEFGGLSVSNVSQFVDLIGSRFSTALRSIDLPCELITVPVLEEIARQCVNLRYMTLDFSKAMQLHDYNDLVDFPANIYYLCVCLSDVIFMEGLMRKIYHCLSTVQVLHLIGTFEQSSEEEEEIYEVINISKIKAHTPNLRVVNLYGVMFVDDSHVELLSFNCVHLECVALNFCIKVTGSSLKNLLEKCKKIKTLLLHHCELVDAHMMAVDWEHSHVKELDITSTELSANCLENVLTRIRSLEYLAVGYCDFFTDAVMEKLMETGNLRELRAIDISYTCNLSEPVIGKFIKRYGPQLLGLMLHGKPLLNEFFWTANIPLLKNIKICTLGQRDGWYFELNTKVHIDQVINAFASHCPKMERLEIQWDVATIRFSHKSGKFIDDIRTRCPFLQSLTLADGGYYEMANSNFERAQRSRVVRTFNRYATSIVQLLSCYGDLLFN